MKVVIAGSRSITNYALLKKTILRSKFRITEVVSGAANGVDLLGIRYAIENKIPFKIFKIEKDDWQKFGKSDGPKRNRSMGDYADALIALWDNHSNGTRDMINYARYKNLKVYVHII